MSVLVSGSFSKEIDRFAAVLSPVLDDKKRRILEKIVKDLKNIR